MYRSLLPLFMMPLILTCNFAYAFVPSNLFNLGVRASVTLDIQQRSFRYSYFISNSSSSQQSVDSFGVTYDSEDFSSIGSPASWNHTENFQGSPFILWYYEGSSPTPVSPGNNQEGFSFVSPCPPTIQTWYASSSYKYVTDDPAEANNILENELDNFFVNSNKGDTIGPGAGPDNSASAAISRTLDLEQKAFQFRWFTSAGLLNSLSVKLRAAADALARSNNTATRNQLGSFINEVDAQRGKALGNTTADLLKANAEYAIILINK